MSFSGTPWFGVLAAVVTGGLLALSLDVGPVGPLALIAPVPLLVYALRAPTAWSVLLAAIAARVLSLAGAVYVYDELPLPVQLAVVVMFSASFAVVVLLTRWIARTAPMPWAVFVYPLLLVTAEWLFGLVSPNGSFGAMGYALVDVLPLLQVASVGGMAALTFCIALVPSAIAVALARPQAWRLAAIAGLAPLLLALAFGALRLTQDYEGSVRVALVGLDTHEALAYRGPDEDLQTARAFAAEVRKAGAANPDFIVLPEKQLGGARPAALSGAVLAEAASLGKATVVVGFDEVLPDGRRVNSAQILVAGQPAQRYFKRHMIPGLETGYETGKASWIQGVHGVAICKDLDFPATLREYGEREVQLLLVPAWDFVLDARMHSRMALVRGVENGFAMARAAAAGRLTASDRYGRVIAEATTSFTEPVSITADLGLRGGGTWYARHGDVFAWLCTLGAAVLLAWRAWRTGARAAV